MPSALVLNLVMALASTSIHDMKPAPDVESFQLDYNQDLAACRLKLEAGICSYLGNLKVEQFEEHYAAALRAARERGDSGEVSCTTPDGSAAYPCVRRETEHLIYHWSILPFPTAPRKEARGYVMRFHPKLGTLISEWAPVSAAAGGEQFLKEIEKRARNRELFGCIGGSCLRYIVQTATAEDMLNQTEEGKAAMSSPLSSYSLCVVEASGGKASMPHTCNAVIVFYGGEAWIKVIRGYVRCFNFGQFPEKKWDSQVEESSPWDGDDFDGWESGCGFGNDFGRSKGTIPGLSERGWATYDIGPTPAAAPGLSTLREYQSWSREVWQQSVQFHKEHALEAADAFDKEATRQFRVARCVAMNLAANCRAFPSLFGGFSEGFGYKPPYPLELPHRARWDAYFGPPIFAWVPATLTVDGEKTVLKWLSMAKAHNRLDCDEGLCTVLRANPDQDSLRTIINVCRESSSLSLGKTEGCYAVATLENHQPGWVRAVIGFGHSVGSGGGGGVMETNWNVRGLSMDVMSNLINQTLTAPPFSFAIGRFGVPSLIRLTATQNNRPSPILSGWREFVSVNVFLYDAGSKTIAMTMQATLQVNRQNTDRPQDWQRPSDEQEAIYRERIANSLRKALGDSCKSATWVNESLLECH